MREIQQECYKLGIPLVTRHREVRSNGLTAPVIKKEVAELDTFPGQPVASRERGEEGARMRLQLRN